MNIVNQVIGMLGLRAARKPNAEAVIMGSVLTSALIILGVEYLKKP